MGKLTRKRLPARAKNPNLRLIKAVVNTTRTLNRCFHALIALSRHKTSWRVCACDGNCRLVELETTGTDGCAIMIHIMEVEPTKRSLEKLPAETLSSPRPRMNHGMTHSHSDDVGLINEHNTVVTTWTMY